MTYWKSQKQKILPNFSLVMGLLDCADLCGAAAVHGHRHTPCSLVQVDLPFVGFCSPGKAAIDTVHAPFYAAVSLPPYSVIVTASIAAC